jgi:nitrate/TMAO reductase-like tetraheme cytochrome c subunit
VAQRLSKQNCFYFKNTQRHEILHISAQYNGGKGVSADNSNCHIVHKLLGNSVTDFKKSENELDLLTSHFSSYIEKAPAHIQLELSDLQCHMEVKQKFTSMEFAQFLGLLGASSIVI